MKTCKRFKRKIFFLMCQECKRFHERFGGHLLAVLMV